MHSLVIEAYTRRAKEDDVPYVGELSQRSDPHGWTVSSLAGSFEQHLCYVLESENGGLKGVAVFQRVLDEAELLYIVINKEDQGQGLGWQFLTGLVDRLLEQGVATFFLEVRESNVAAQRLYQKLGFSQVGVRKNYYPQTALGPQESALLYQRVATEFQARSKL